MQSPKIIVVVPTYNERKTLPILLDRLTRLEMPNLQVLVVDDNSPDGTGEVADRLAAGSPRTLAVLHRPEKCGLGRAYVAGMTRAIADGADIVIQMDADLSHPPSVVPAMVDILTSTDAALVIGSRYVRGGSTAADWPWHRKAQSIVANHYVNAILRLHVRDVTAGFRAWRATALSAIDLPSAESSGYSFQVEMSYRAVKCGFEIVEVPISFVERADGASKMTLAVQIESALTPWKLLLRRSGS